MLTSSEFEGPDQVHIGNGSGMQIQHIGNSSLHSSKSNTIFNLRNLLHVPKITKNLISVSQFAHDNNVYFEFYPNVCFVKSQVSKEILLQGKLRDGLYMFEDVSVPSKSANSHALYNSVVHYANFNSACNHPVKSQVFNSSCNSYVSVFPLSHKRLGHPSNKIVSQVLSDCNIPLNLNKSASTSNVCNACCMAKVHQLPHPVSSHKYNSPLELVYSDIWGPAPIPARSGCRYYICFLDAYTKYSCISLLENRS